MTKGNKKKIESFKRVCKWKIFWSKELIFKSLCVLVKWAKNKAGWQRQKQCSTKNTKVKKRRWRWIDHVLRMKKNEHSRTAVHHWTDWRRSEGNMGPRRAGDVAGYFTVERNKREWKELISHPTSQVERAKWSLWGYTVIWLIFKIYVDRVTLV